MKPLIEPVVQTVMNEWQQSLYFGLGCFITYWVMHSLYMIRKPKCYYIHEFKGINAIPEKRTTLH